MPTHASVTPLSGNPGRDPFDLFMGSHTQIREALTILRGLAQAGDPITPTAEQRANAEQLLSCFDTVVLPHHREEEREFWPLVSRMHGSPEDHASFVEAAARLQHEHVDLESRWVALQPALTNLAQGRSTALPASALTDLAAMYSRHAQFEEEVLVPLARHLLSPTEQGRLAIAVLLSRLPAAKWGMV